MPYKPFALKNRNGRRVLRPDARRNATPKTLNVEHAGAAEMLHTVFAAAMSSAPDALLDLRGPSAKKLKIVSPATTAAMHSGEIDGRTMLSRNERRWVRRLKRQYGNTPSLELLCHAMARVETILLIARNAIVSANSVGDQFTTSGAVDALLRATRELRELLNHPLLQARDASPYAIRDVTAMTDEELELIARGVPIPTRQRNQLNERTA